VNAIATAADKYPTETFSIILHFVRAISTTTVIDAIVNALSAPGQEYQKEVEALQELLVAHVEALGMEKEDEIHFTYYGVTSIAVTIRNQYVGSVSNQELRERLAAIYTGPKAVASEVHATLTQRYA
jgi:hypothetical protein